MLPVPVDMSPLYVPREGGVNRQPFQPLDIPLSLFLQGREQVHKGAYLTLADKELNLGVVAQVIEVNGEENKVVVLVPMEQVYSLNSPATNGVVQQPVQETIVVSPSSKKKFVSLGITATLVCVAYIALLYYWEGFVPAFLILNSPFDDLLISMAESREKAGALLVGAWGGVLAPFVAVVASWNHWKEGGDGISGGMATLLSAATAGFSSLLLVAAFKVKTATAGFFHAGSLTEALSALKLDESSMLYTEEGTILLWGVFALLWFLVILTGISAHRAESAKGR